ncbi:MAG: energy transducer TonB [Treponema sp.]|nr:energy transducer TonB [Treponema sp.]
MKKKTVWLLCIFSFNALVSLDTAFGQNRRIDPRTKNSMWLPPAVNVTEGNRHYHGTAGDSSNANASDSSIKEAATIKEYTTFQQLQTLINERLKNVYFYPERARNRGIEGTVNLLVDISPYGTLMDCRELGTSPQLLSQAAKQQIEQVFPLPVALEDTIRNYTIQITYKLQ